MTPTTLTNVVYSMWSGRQEFFMHHSNQITRFLQFILLRTVMPLECHWWTQCSLGYHWATQRNSRVHWDTTGKLIWNCPTLECHWRNSDYCSLHGNTTGWTITANTRLRTYSYKQSSIHASLKWQDDGTLVYCSPGYTSIALQTCEYFAITLCMPCIWTPL